MTDSRESLSVRANIPKVLSQIDSQEAVTCLVRGVQQLSPFLAYRAIKALNKMRIQFAHLAFNDQAIDLAILEELRDYYQFGIMLFSGEMERAETRAILRLLRSALQERMDQKLERVFRLLGLRYPPKDIYSAYNGLRSPQSHVRASAIEFLDNLLMPDLKQLLFPVLEEVAVDTFVTGGNQYFGLHPKTWNAYLEQLITGRDEWLQTLALYVAADLGLTDLTESVRAAQASESALVRETAQRSLKILESSAVI
jgi:AAA family ATP:ADP antiporter